MKVIKNCFCILLCAFSLSNVCSAESQSSEEQLDFSAIDGKDILKARSILIAEKWDPVETFETLFDGTLESELGMAGDLKKLGVVEVASCAGTGMAPCAFNYRKNKSCISIYTQGEYEKNKSYPVVFNWSAIDCETLVLKKKPEPHVLLKR